MVNTTYVVISRSDTDPKPVCTASRPPYRARQIANCTKMNTMRLAMPRNVLNR